MTNRGVWVYLLLYWTFPLTVTESNEYASTIYREGNKYPKELAKEIVVGSVAYLLL